MNANSITNAILLAIYERWDLSACVFRANVIAAMASRGMVKSLPKGTADIIGCVDGRAVAIEVKTPNDRLSPAQRKFRDAWERAGGIYIEARSVDQAMRELEERMVG